MEFHYVILMTFFKVSEYVNNFFIYEFQDLFRLSEMNSSAILYILMSCFMAELHFITLYQQKQNIITTCSEWFNTQLFWWRYFELLAIQNKTYLPSDGKPFFTFMELDRWTQIVTGWVLNDNNFRRRAGPQKKVLLIIQSCQGLENFGTWQRSVESEFWGRQLRRYNLFIQNTFNCDNGITEHMGWLSP